jgi:redox-sensitive bicupin YhaK (pirin superfamily)
MKGFMMSEKIREVARRIEPQYVMEGAGVRLKRSIATPQLDYLDPFLLLDHFGSDNPEDYIAGFPMHPHRGIETVTYMLAGEVRHEDSLGNAGMIHAGDVQWMTSGRGIMHEEMPGPVDGKMEGFQLWVNLPAKLKMSPPRYQEILTNAIPEVQTENGILVRVIAGEANGVKGPVTEIAIQPTYLDVHMPAGTTWQHPTPEGHTVFAYLYEGSASFGSDPQAKNEDHAPRLLIFNDGQQISSRTGDSAAKFLVIMGAPLHEPIARYGPFVMNTREEIRQTLSDLRDGTFIQP